MNDTERGSSPLRGRGTQRADVLLFVIYVALYAVFMGLTAFAPETLAMRVIGGVNLAVAYGIGLILAAALLAGIAMFLRHDEGGRS